MEQQHKTDEVQGKYTARKNFHDALDDILDRPIAYNPAFKRITQSTVAGILLSQAWYWSKRHKDTGGWFYKCQAEWEEETGLTRYEQETARRHCRTIGVMDEKLRGVPATMHYRVNREKVYELLGFQYAETPQTEYVETPQTGLGPLPLFAGKQQSGVSTDFNKESETSPMIPPEIYIWQELSSQIEGDMRRDRFTEVIKNAIPLSCHNGVLVVEEPTMEAMEWAKSRLTSTIEKLLVGILNIDKPSVKFVVREEVPA